MIWRWFRRLLVRWGMNGFSLSYSWELPTYYSVEAEKKVALQPDDAPELRTSRDLRHAHPELAKRFLRMKADFEHFHPKYQLIITCTYRSPEEQRRLYKQGRFGNGGQIITNCDGFNNKSDHNHYPSRALDLCITDGGKVAFWDEVLYYPIGKYAHNHGLKWGGEWKKFKDYPHVYLPDDVE